MSKSDVSTARRVLVVDDDADSASVLALLLRSQGHEVRTAVDGASGLTEARSFAPEVVLLDLGLPDMSGFEVAEELRRHRGRDGLVLIAVTGYGGEGIARRCSDAGFDHHMVKPILDFGALLDIVRTLDVPAPGAERVREEGETHA